MTVVLVAIAVGAGVGAAMVARTQRRARIALGAIALGALTLGALAYAQAGSKSQQTVTHEHQASWVIDERAGSIRGVGLGDAMRQLQKVFGPGSRWRPTARDPVPWRLPGGSVFDGPSNFGDGLRSDVFLRYRTSVFEIRRGKIGWIKITDPRAATSAGIGPGDSIMLVKRDYPNSRCAQDALGGDPPVLYPYCSVELSPSRWLTFFATYQQPGTPVLAVWLSIRPIE